MPGKVQPELATISFFYNSTFAKHNSSTAKWK